MRRHLLALALALPALAPLTYARPSAAEAVDQEKTGELTANRVAERVQAFYNRTRTFQADFKQEFTIKAHNQKKTSEGRVAFEKPGKMSFTYAQPVGNRVVSDGKTLRVYEAENKQMFEQQVDRSQYPAALAFLMGEGNLQESFELRLLDARAMGVTGAWVLEGTPKEPTPAYQKVLLYVDEATAQVRRVLILDAQGNRNRFDFSKPVVNTKIPPKEFNFAPPAGTQVIKP